MRVLVFGDSIVQGFWDIDGGWVARLRKYYDERQLDDLQRNNWPTVFNLGVSGATSSTILERFDAEVIARKSEADEIAIVISTGVNDSYVEVQDKINISPEEYEANLQELVQRAKNHSQRIMFVGLVAVDESRTQPVSWREIYYSNDRVKTFESSMQKVADANSAAFIPIHDRFKSQLDAGRELLADGLHPNSIGHEFIFQIVLPELNQFLK